MWEILPTEWLSYWGAQNQTQDSRGGLTSAEGKDHIPRPASNSPLMILRIPPAFCAARTCCWLVFSLVSIRIPRSFLAKLLSSLSASSMSCCMERRQRIWVKRGRESTFLECIWKIQLIIKVCTLEQKGIDLKKKLEGEKLWHLARDFM